MKPRIPIARRVQHGMFCLLPLTIVAILLLLATGGCARLDRDPLQVYQTDPDAFSIPITTLGIVPF